MTRGALSRTSLALAGFVLIGLVTACAASRDALDAAPSGGATTPTRPSTSTTTTAPKPKPKLQPKRTPKPRPKPRPKPAPVTTHPRTSSAPPAPRPTPKPTPTPSNCDPAYPDQCLHDGIGDYDCSSGSGNGPNYVHGPLQVLPPDPFGLDADHDGIGCERG